ncbi:MAG TPA: potassium channel protein [Pyrinomonadaceae bacterium]|nr:potassium channel protein [Pyrinomonadaceae bacterium]
MSSTHPSLHLTKSARRRMLYALAALGALIVIGTLGFSLLEPLTLLDSLYLTVMTVATVGYGDVHPVSRAGRAFSIVFMLVSVATVGFLLSTAIQALVQSEIVAAYGQRRRSREINKLRNHFIICGAGRVGSRIIRELQRLEQPFIVIEREQQQVANLIDEDVLVLVRDATLEETLRDAGVEHARALAACLPDDADNVYVVLTARGLNNNLHIVARAVEEQAEPKLIRAGANRVIAPIIIGGQRMLQALTKPAVADFIESIAAEDLDLDFEEVVVSTSSPYVGHKLKFTNIRSELDVVIVAVRRASNSEMIFNPSGDTYIEAGDMLIAIGRSESLAQLKVQAQRKQ